MTTTRFVEVAEHAMSFDFVPFSATRTRVPGSLIVGRIYGPFTVKGAERVARRALSMIDAPTVTYPSGVRYRATDEGVTVVKVLDSLPAFWAKATARNMPMVKRSTPEGTIWVCQDCMITDASGEEPDDRDATQPEPWSLDPSGEYTMGRLDHDCGLSDEERSETQCDCEERSFSWSACEGCGSTLGGSRYAYTYWL